jgi:outer membrane receptor protein involved in Fe transport
MRQLAIRLLATGTLLTSFHALAKEPAEGLENFDIKAQPLSIALREYAQATGEQIVFFSEIGRKRDSTPVQGQYTRDQALQKILENTGLHYQRLNSKTIAIGTQPRGTSNVQHVSASVKPIRLAQIDTTARRTAQRTAPADEQAPAAAAETPTAEAMRPLEEVVVTGTAVQERTRFDSSVAISTFSAEDIAQQSPASSADLISAVPGFWVESTAGTTQGNVFARGIIQDGGYRYVTLMEDGIPIYPVSELSFYNPDQFVRVDETIDHVEALRGGTAPIFNSGAIGGTVNFVTQAPGNFAQGIAKLSITDYSMYRADFAYRAPLNDDWGIAFGGYYRRSDGIRDPGYAADKGGQLRFKVTRSLDKGNLELFAKYINDHSMFVVPIPLQGKASDPSAINGQDAGTYALQSANLAAAPLPVSAAEVGLAGSNLEDGIHPDLFTAGAKLRWDFSDMISLTNVLRYTDGSVRFDGIFPGDAPVTGTAFAATRGVAPTYTYIGSGGVYAPTQFVQNHGHWVVDKQYKATQDDLRVSFKLDSNNLTLGLYLADYSMQDHWSLGNQLLMDVSSRPRRLFLPGVTDTVGYTSYSTFNLRTDYDATAYALYVSDEWQVLDRLRLDFGVRYDRQSIDAAISNAASVDLDNNPATTYNNSTSLAGPTIDRDVPDYHNTGYSAGFNFDLTDTQALFGHYTKSAKLPHFDDVRNASDLSQLKKDVVTNIEFGYKIATPLFGMFATAFQTEFDNIPFQDILANGSTVVRRAGTRTRGVELEGVLQPLDSLDIRFSITQQDPKYTSFSGSVLDNTGNTIRRIPKTMLRIMPTYAFLDDRAKVFGTFTRAGKRFANDENTIVLPAYNKFDAGVLFDINDAWTVQISGDNLTDEVGLTEGNPRTDVGAAGSGAVYMARPLFGRSFQASTTVKF